MFQKAQIQTSDTLQVYHGEYRGIFEKVEFWAVFSALQAKNGQNVGIIWMYSQWLQLLGLFNLIQADVNLREWLRNPFSHFRIRANEGDMNSLTVVNVNISIWIKLLLSVLEFDQSMFTLGMKFQKEGRGWGEAV